MISICLLFGIFPNSIRRDIESNSKGSVQYAADALQKSFIAGITTLFRDVSIVNIPFIPSYPQRYKQIKAPFGLVEKTTDGVSGRSYSFLNLPLLRFLSKRAQATKGLKEWNNKSDGEKIIIIYSAHSPLLEAAVAFKERVDNKVKIILIVPDLPEYMAPKRGAIIELLKKINLKTLQRLYRSVDGFILLSELMCERLPIDNKPYRVIEGIFNPQDQQSVHVRTEKTVFYGGTLDRRYGVMNLVNAFIKARINDYVLEICGRGDSEEEIKKKADSYSNIHYLGFLKREQVLKKQMSASLLVNPRTPEGEFTKYSFPSKTMEYFASGVPTLLYRLPGIPEEYYNYCFSMTHLGVDNLALKLKEILEMPDEKRKEIGSNAKQFILSQKNPVEQCKKISELIYELTRSE